MLRIRRLWRRDFDQLDLVELVHADNPARLASGRTGFAPEAGRVSSEFLRQLRYRQDFFPVKICYRHFRGRREEKLLALEPVHVLLELRQLRRPDHTFAPHQKRGAYFEITMLAGV